MYVHIYILAYEEINGKQIIICNTVYYKLGLGFKHSLAKVHESFKFKIMTNTQLCIVLWYAIIVAQS